MSLQETISFVPKWYRVGDPDVPEIAVAYGILALTSIWLLEALIHRILFSSHSDMSLSHVETLVAFHGSSWKDIFVWLFWNLRPRSSGAKDGDCSKKMNRRASSAVLLRLVAILLEITLLFLSVPRTIPIFEDQVGSTQMRFETNITGRLDRAQVLTREMPCNADPVPYADFTPSAIRQICISGFSTFIHRTEIAPGFPNGTEIYVLSHDEMEHKLMMLSLGSQWLFTLQHVIRLASRSGQTLSLPLPNNIAEQAIAALFSSPKIRRKCSLITPVLTNNTVFYTVYCVPSSSEPIASADELPNYLLSVASTTRASATLQKGKISHEKFRSLLAFPQVGTINRPTMCLYPALIVFSVLVVFNFIACKVFGDEEILFYLFRFSSKAMNAKFTGNPLLVESKTYAV